MDYEISDTSKTATWNKRSGWEGRYNCSNCGHEKNPGYPAKSFTLSKFCPNCGFRMVNPQFVKIEYEYDDYY